jgi:hypothetical protein
MSPGSAHRQRHSCRIRMIDMGAFGLPPWTRTFCSQGARRTAPLAPRSWPGVTLHSVAGPGSSGESAARAGLPERRWSGYCSLAAWYRTRGLKTGSLRGQVWQLGQLFLFHPCARSDPGILVVTR